MQANLETREHVIDHYKMVITERDQKIKDLEALLTGLKCNDYTRSAKAGEKKDVPAHFGRAGWRSRAKLASDRTIPAPNDSIQALEQRVKEQGGS